MLKQFDPEQWALFDAPAKQAATTFWSQLGFTCIENPDEFGIDLLVRGKGKEFGCEVEVKTQWHGANFTFPTLHVALRKRKFLTSPCHFMVFNQGLTHAALMSRNVILASPVIEVKNATVPVGERFYDVPTSEFTVLNVIAPLTLS
jgi:hypothetical protein